jgi:hypothetical protein
MERAFMSAELLSRKRIKAVGNRRRPAPQRQNQERPDETPQWLEHAKALPDLRWSKVQALRDALAAGEYDVDQRLGDLFDRLPGELANLETAPE